MIYSDIVARQKVTRFPHLGVPNSFQILWITNTVPTDKACWDKDRYNVLGRQDVLSGPKDILRYRLYSLLLNKLVIKLLSTKSLCAHNDTYATQVNLSVV